MPRLWIQITAIIALVVGIYQFAPHAQFMPVDDASLSYGNPIVKEFDVKSAFTTYDPELYIPLTLLSYQIEYLFFGNSPMGYHITNVVLHILNAILVLLLVRYWTTRWEVPFITAALFAIHPINTEAVMWISGRKDLLSTFFLLSALLFYCRHRVSGRSAFFYASLTLFIAGLFTKVLVVTMPLLMMIIDDLIPMKKTPYEKLSKWAFYIPAIVFLGIGMIKKFLSMYSITYTQSILLAGKSVMFYLKQLLVPTHLSMFYKQNTPIELSNPEFFLPLAALVVLVCIVFQSKQLGKLFAFGVIWFGICVLPNLANAAKGGKADIYYASDRYVYVACIGIFFLLSLGLIYLLDHSKAYKKIVMGALIIALPCLYAIQAHQYSVYWLTPKAYMRNVIAHYPETPIAQTIVGLEELEEENSETAMQHFRYALEISPEFDISRVHLGLALMKAGNIDEGMSEIKKIQEMKMDREYTYAFLAFGYTLLGEYSIAEGLLHQVLSIIPEDSRALHMMGILAKEQGDLAEAQKFYWRSIESNPNDVRPKAALARLMKSL
ncbi:MAG: hypothetical protein O3A80_04755 [bacterium]|nr:hypothetical protein [bacterium]